MDTQNLTTSPNKTPERWLPVPGYEGLYDISDRGRVRSYWKCRGKGGGWDIMNTPQKIINQTLLDYPVVKLIKGKGAKRISKTVHQLVLLVFVGPCPPGHEGCHKDGIRAHSFLENLEWGTKSKNALDRVKHGTGPQFKGMDHPNAKLTDERILKIRGLYSKGYTLKELSKIFGVHFGTIHCIVRRKTWAHI